MTYYYLGKNDVTKIRAPWLFQRNLQVRMLTWGLKLHLVFLVVILGHNLIWVEMLLLLFPIEYIPSFKFEPVYSKTISLSYSFNWRIFLKQLPWFHPKKQIYKIIISIFWYFFESPILLCLFKSYKQSYHLKNLSKSNLSLYPQIDYLADFIITF